MKQSEPVIHSDPEIMGGTPVFVGTSYRVSSQSPSSFFLQPSRTRPALRDPSDRIGWRIQISALPRPRLRL